MTYTTTVNGTRVAPVKVEVKQKSANSTYTFGPFEIMKDSFQKPLFGSFTATYDASKQSFLMKGPEFIGYLTGDAYPWTYMCFIRSATSLTTSSTVQMEGKINVDEEGIISCDFIDNGTWSGSTAIGWGFFNFANQEFTGSIYSKKIFIDIKMTKRGKLTM